MPPINKFIKQKTATPGVHAGSTEHRIFSDQYFSGTDVHIYFGDIYVDEITGIELTVQENVQPIYGYASYTADAWARGTRLITGTFRINFKESYYLHAICQTLEDRLSQSETLFRESDEGVVADKIEDVLVASQEIQSSERFQHLANEYQRSIWGQTMGEADPFAGHMRNQQIDSYFYPNRSQSHLHEHGLNILITYGPFIQAYPHLQDDTPARETINHTIESITGVQLASVTKLIQGDARPIEEQYSFIARDINYKIR